VNPEEAKLVCNLYRLYLELGCVSKLKIRLDQQSTKSKMRVSAAGRKSGEDPYSRGALYQILQNRIYVGEIHHQGQSYPGEHQAIVPKELWERVQVQFKSDHQGRRNGLKANSPSLLVGLIKDGAGNPFTPSQTLKNGKRYRYYVCQATHKPTRLPAHDVETQVSLRLQSFLRSNQEVVDELGLTRDLPAKTQQLIAAASTRSDEWSSTSPAGLQDFVRKVVQRVVVQPDKIEIEVGKRELLAVLTRADVATSRRSVNGQSEHDPADVILLEVDARVKRCGSEVRLVVPPHSTGEVSAHPYPSLLKAIARGHDWYTRIVEAKAWGRRSLSRQTGLDDRYVSRILQCAFLAPDIVEAILVGRQSSDFSLERLRNKLPSNWAEQRKRFDFPPRA
jgi:hypothetical protein